MTRAEVVAEQQSTFAALERHLPELQAALAAAGFEGVEVDLRHAGDGSAHSPFQPRALHGAQSARQEAARPPAELTRALSARIANSNGVDTYA